MTLDSSNILPPVIDGDRSRGGALNVDIIREALRLLFQNWRLLIGCIAGFVAIAAAAALILPKTYLIEAQILMLNKRLAEPGAYGSSHNSYVRYESPRPEDLQTEIKILETSDILIRSLLSMEREQSVTGPPGAPPLRDHSGVGDAIAPELLEEVADGLSFSVVPGAHVIEIAFKTGDAEFGASFVNVFLDEYLAIRQKILANDGSITLHAQNRDFYLQRLETLEQRMLDLQQQSQVGDLDQEKVIALQHIEQELADNAALQDRVIEIGQLLEFLETSVESLRAGGIETPLSMPARFTDDELRDAHASLFTALGDLQTRRATYTATSDAMRGARAAYVRQRTSYFRLVERKIVELRSEKAAIENSISEKEKRIRQLSARNADLQTLLAARQTIAIEQAAAQDAFLAASARLNASEASRTSEYNGFSNVRILQMATPPDAPASPNLKLNLVLGFLTGGIIAAMLIAYRKLSSTVVNSEHDIERVLMLPVIDSFSMADRV